MSARFPMAGQDRSLSHEDSDESVGGRARPNTTAIAPPTLRDILRMSFHRFIHRLPDHRPDSRRDTILVHATMAVRAGRYEEAASVVAPLAAVLASDAAFLNLMGVICESREQWKSAGRFYGLAMSADPAFLPARHNMKRYYEILTFGRTSEPPHLATSSGNYNPCSPQDLRLKGTYPFIKGVRPL